MAHTIAISDGATTINFLGSNYKILAGGAGWAPRVARRRRSQLGGRSPYIEVPEEMAIQVKGTSESDCWSKLQDLIELMEQAEAFGMGENVTPVYLEYEPDNSGLANSVKSVIIGPARDSFVEMPVDTTFRYRNGRYVLGTVNDPILLSFVRLGLLLGADETKASSESSGNPAILATAAFTDTASLLWPYDVELDINATTQGLVASSVYMLFQNASNKLYLAEAESKTLSNASSTAIATASGGNVARCDSSSVQICSITDGAPGFATGVEKIALFAVCRNRSADTVDWSVYGTVFTAGDSLTGRKTVIANGDNNIKTVSLGVFSLPATISQIRVSAVNSTTGAAADHGLDIDYIAAVAIDDDSRIVNITTSAEGADSEIHIDHRLDSDLVPLVYQTTSGGGTVNDYPPYYGNAVLAASGNVVACLVFGHSSASTTLWTLADGGPADVDLTLNVTRTAGYLNPL